MLQNTLRAGRVVVGIALLLVGGVLALPGIPGPGLVVIFGGLSVLSTEFHWAHRLREGMRRTVSRVTGRDHE
jgi:uncharacterized protein (TIGR02611 family)